MLHPYKISTGLLIVTLWSLLFYYFQLQMNSETYIDHQLNQSKTKQSHKFGKANRFPKSLKKTEAIYNLPTSTSKRATTFGYGTKIDLVQQKSSPPPGSYNAVSEFEKKDFKNTPTIYQGRQKVTFGSFLLQALKRSKNVPSPDKYTTVNNHRTIGGVIGQIIKTEPDLKQKKSIPGPGAYKLNATEMGNKGTYILSTIKNYSSPRYYTESGYSLDKEKFIRKNQKMVAPKYDIQQKEVGKYYVSKYRNIMSCSFSKGQRSKLQDESKLKFPGFKYRRFSQFGN